jgi:hypothetical protein
VQFIKNKKNMKVHIIITHSDQEESVALDSGYLNKAVAEEKVKALRAVGIAHNEWVCKKRSYVNNSKEWAEHTAIYEAARKNYSANWTNSPLALKAKINNAVQEALTARDVAVRKLEEAFREANPEPKRDSSYYTLQEISIV